MQTEGGKPKVVVIQGPTGAGKTAAALELSGALPIEIVNADSMQVYRGMDIGTSKPTPEEQAPVPHHLFSIVSPDEEYNAAMFMRQGRQVIDEIVQRGRVPVVVGGTGLYIRALVQGLFKAPGRDAELRKSLQAGDKAALFAELARVDPETARRLSPNDRVRVVRALEVFHVTGEPLSRHHRRHGFQDAPFSCLKIYIVRDREALYLRIDRRVELMIQAGLVEEVRGLLAAGLDPGLRPLQSIGYRQVVQLIQGQRSTAEAVNEIKRETRRFAKRQLTWFRKDREAIRVRLPGRAGEIAGMVKNFLNNQ